jgi:hypothetical protein
MVNKNFSYNMIGVDRYWQNEFHYQDTQPTIDDSRLTFYHTFAINSQKSIESKCKSNINSSDSHFSKALHLNQVKEVNLLFINDIFEGILITIELISGMDSIINIETLIRPFDNKTKNYLSEKLMDLEVNTFPLNFINKNNIYFKLRFAPTLTSKK